MGRPAGDDGFYRPFMAVHYRNEAGNIPPGLPCRDRLFAISPSAYGKAPKTTDVRDVTCGDCRAWLRAALEETGNEPEIRGPECEECNDHGVIYERDRTGGAPDGMWEKPCPVCSDDPEKNA